ncbi:hypothetical protein VCHA53O466_40431 [Vibrio chagasii]|nr:hypothetical protein VCHA53O466_40431 [Vibrio chagasii]
MIFGSEVKTIVVELKGKTTELSVIQEESGLIFAVDASYVEQDVAAVTSPYAGHGTLAFEGDDSVNTANQPDAIKHHLEADGKDEHPIYTKSKWRKSVANCRTELGYWEYVANKL